MKVKLVSPDGKHKVEVEPVDAKELQAGGYTVEVEGQKKEVKKRAKRQGSDSTQADTGKTTA